MKRTFIERYRIVPIHMFTVIYAYRILLTMAEIFTVRTFHYWNILLLRCFFVVVGFSICINVFAVGNALGLPIILAGPNLGQSIKKGESLKSFTDSLWAVL